MLKPYTAWKVSKHGVISGLYLPVFSPNTGKHGPEITSYLDTFHAVFMFLSINLFNQNLQVGVIKLTIRGFGKQNKKRTLVLSS